MKLNCLQCGAVLNVPDRAAGKRIRCPKCQHEFRAPATGLPAKTEPDAGGGTEESSDRPQVSPSGSSSDIGLEPAPNLALEELASDVQSPRSAPRVSRGRRIGPLSKLPVEIPNYSGVKFLGYVFWVLGVLLWVLAAGIVITACSKTSPPKIVEEPGFYWQGPDFGQMLIVLAVAAFLTVLGFTSVGFGQLFFCIRDQTRNSFYLRRLL